jgi:hypothetical protein
MYKSLKTVLPTALAVLVLSLGCAQDLGTIDRVQNNLTLKSDLLFTADGMRKEWYIQTTTVQAPYASAYSFQGDQGPMERGIFDIQENVLYFYRTYTFVENEWAGNPRRDVDMVLRNADGTPYLLNGEEVWVDKNAPLLAYPITAHVDIIWEYNPNTGEKSNVRVENTSDRLWHEREYLRVRWGNNMMPSWSGWAFSVASASVPIFFHDESSAPELEARVNPETGYMDFVNDWVFGAGTMEYEGYGTVPLCWFNPWYVGGVFECISEKIRVRTAFLEVDPVREEAFEPQQYSDHDMERFGYFRTERLVWDKAYGTTYTGFRRYANYYDIWQKDVSGNVIGVKPIIYYLNEDHPDNVVEESIQVGVEWSKAFDAAVRAATGRNPGEFDAYRQNGEPMLDADGNPVSVQHMFIVCENNAAAAAAREGLVAETDESICGPMDEPRRMGDLRYSFLNALPTPTQVGLYGYGPSAPNPLSGRVVSSVANNYLAAMREGANRALNQIELTAGVKSFREIAEGEYIAQAMRNERLKKMTYWKNGFTLSEAQQLASAMLPEEVKTGLTGGMVQKTDRSVTQARMALLSRNPDIENLFVNDDVRMLFKDPRLGQENLTILDPHVKNYVLRNWAHGGGMTKMIETSQKMAERGLDMAEFFDGALLRLAQEYKARYDAEVCTGLRNASGTVYDFSVFNDTNPCSVEALVDQLRIQFAYYNQSSPYGFKRNYIPTPLEMETHEPVLINSQKAMQDILQTLRPVFMEELYKRIYFGVAIHEVGHTLGLRHNFEASTDALNFHPKYWDLRVTKQGDNYVPVGLWGETPEQAAQSIREYQYSSVMDYYIKFNMPWAGLGLYDIAAIKYAYAGTMEVFRTNPDLSQFQNYLDVDPTLGQPSNEPVMKDRGENFGKALRRIHATNYPNFWGDSAKIYDRVDVPRDRILGEKCATEGAACSNGRVCKSFYEGLRCTDASVTAVPYRFGGDELTWRLPTVNMFDEGVDSFEIVNNFRETYENYWVFNGYWHQDPTFWPTDYDNWVRFIFYQMKMHYQAWVINYATYNKDDYWMKRFGKRWETDLNGGLPGAMATWTTFNVLAGTFGRPSPANYGFNILTQRYEPVDSVNIANYRSQVVLMEEEGARPIYSNWDYNGYLPNVTSAGSIYDRLAAFEMLSDPEVLFFAVDKRADTRKYLINFATVFPNEMRELFGGLMANNTEKYGWCILLHPVSEQPMTFGPREYVGFNYQGQTCDNSYDGCFTVTASNAPDTFVSLLGLEDLRGCPAGTTRFAMPGRSLEPEPLYTFPTTRFRIPMLAAYYGMALLVNNYDRSFMDASRIWLKGSKYEITPPAGAEIAQCEDRFSGRIYQTYRLTDGRYYPAYDLVSQCDFLFSCYDPDLNDLLTEDQKSECKAMSRSATPVEDLTLADLRADYLFHPIQFLIGKLELIRAMHQTYEYPQSTYDYSTGQ